MDERSELSGPWLGVSGRSYVPAPGAEVRDGASHRVVPVIAQGEGRRPHDPPPGRKLGLLLPLFGTHRARAALERELNALSRLSEGAAASPGARLHDRLEGDTLGAVVDWCPSHLEQWWGEVVLEAEGYRNLCLAMADVCRRTGDWAGAARREPELERSPPRVRPRSVLRTTGGRWVLSGFGAELQPSLDQDDEGGRTEVMTASSHFQPPEELFHASSEHPMAALTWAIGTTFFTLLKMRAYLVSQAGERKARLPSGGTDSPHLGSHRSALIDDLLRRKPAIFADRDLDPRQFLYPDRLPDRDRRTIADAMAGLLGPGQEIVEGQLARDCLKLLDSALSIDPARRYLDPIVMAGDFEGLARRFRLARSSVAAARLAPEAAELPPSMGSMGDEPTEEAPIDEPSGDAPTAQRDAPLTSEVAPEGAPRAAPRAAAVGVADGPDAVAVGVVVSREPPPTRAGYDAPALAGGDADRDADDMIALYKTPAWVKGALAGLALGQILTLVLVGLTWTRQAAPPAVIGLDPALSEQLELVAAPLSPELAAQPTVATPVFAAPEAPADTGPAGPELAEALAEPAEPAEPAVPAEPAEPAEPAVPAPAVPAPAATASPGARAAPTRAPAPEADAPDVGTITVVGAVAKVRGAAGTLPLGEVPAGQYTVLVRETDGWVEACQATVKSGQQAVVRCGFGQCKQVE